MRRVLALALFACLPAVALADKAPWAEIDGSVVDATQGDLAPVAVVKVGDKALSPCRGGADKSGTAEKTTGSLFDNFDGDRKRVTCVDPTKRLKLAPGAYETTIATTRLAKSGVLATQQFAFTAEACMRYRLVARHDGPSAKRFAVEVATTERIDGCTLPVVAAAVDPAAAAPAADATPAPGAVGGTPKR